MAITFDNSDEIRKIIRYDSTAGTYTGVSIAFNQHNSTFDYFTDTFVAGDWIAFGGDFGVWHDLVLNVGTALAGTGVTGVWEYKTGKSAWSTLTVTDGTNGFTTTGVNTVAFSVPADWYSYYGAYPYTGNITGMSGITTYAHQYYWGLWIRYRITGVTMATEGGANTTDYASGKDWSVMVDGGSVTPTDIYNADVSGGWGVVTKDGDSTVIRANLKIGDVIYYGITPSNATTLSLVDEQLQIGDTTSPMTMYAGRTCTLNMGQKDGSGNTYNGAVLKYHNHWTHYGTYSTGSYLMWRCAINMYNSIFTKYNAGFNDPSFYVCALDVINSMFTGNFFYFYADTGTLKNVVLEMGSTSNKTYDYSSNLALDNIMIARGTSVVVGSNDVTIANIDFGTDKIFQASNTNVTAYAKDCKFTDYSTQLYPLSTGTTTYVQYTLSLTFLDEENIALSGVYVKVVDGQDAVLFNGVWSTSLVTIAYKAIYSGSVGGTPTNYNPIRLYINKNGYEPEFMEFTLTNANKNQTVTLKRATSLNQHKTVNV